MDKNKPGVAGVIIRTNNKVLLCQRSMDSTLPGIWSVPGGHIEKGEDPKSAAVREFFEETNIKLSPEVLQFVGTLPVETAEDKSFHIFLYDTDDELKPDLEGAKDGREHTRCRYVRGGNIPTTTSSLDNLLNKVILK
jgi:8-oxo-dGTP pyrophosphatase MutT (NUDIX family)